MGFKKIDREFLLTDNSVNVYGYRLLSEGYMLEKYKPNPIGYRMHNRDDGVLVKWEDFRWEGDKLYAKPNVNLSNPLGQQTADEIENGFLNAASMGGIVVVEFSDDPSLMMEGQTGPTVTKWYNKEVSLVDVPGNPNAVAQLYDINDNEINLLDFIERSCKKQPLNLWAGFNNKLKQNEMALKVALISALALSGLNLSDNTSDEQLANHVKDLVDKANRVEGLEANVSVLSQEKQKAIQDLADYKKAENAARVKAITDAGVAAGKLTVALVQDLADKYASDPEGLQKLVDGLPAYRPITSRIGEGAANELANLSWEELDRSNKLPDLKEADIEVFKSKFKAHFGTDYKG